MKTSLLSHPFMTQSIFSLPARKKQCNRTQAIIAGRPGKRKTKKMEDKQINRCISGPSSAVQHNLGCLAPEGLEDFSVQLRSEFRSSAGIVHPSISFWFSLLLLLNRQLWRRAKVRPVCRVSIYSERENPGNGGSDRENTQEQMGRGWAMTGGIRGGRRSGTEY